MEKKPLIFDHLITYVISQPKNNWQEGNFVMETLLLSHDIYRNGPIFFTYNEAVRNAETGNFTYFMPINDSITFEKNGDFQYMDTFTVDNALVLRQAQEEPDFYAAYQKVKDYATENEIQLTETYYCVLLEVYGEYMIDLYVPIKEEGYAS
ncbi:DUF5085 family protein [Metabacillus sp. KIGAM252]|uniref:DUF5085 family protein n=1 Tax=Metabacillus flavus TaxID=2823519 RepID=A0ABS5LA60_9BACI|nr:DUF5085 family protein [Metabacillus flavus]